MVVQHRFGSSNYTSVALAMRHCHRPRRVDIAPGLLAKTRPSPRSRQSDRATIAFLIRFPFSLLLKLENVILEVNAKGAEVSQEILPKDAVERAYVSPELECPLSYLAGEIVDPQIEHVLGLQFDTDTFLAREKADV